MIHGQKKSNRKMQCRHYELLLYEIPGFITEWWSNWKQTLLSDWIYF